MAVKSTNAAYLISTRGVAGGTTAGNSPEQWTYGQWWCPVDGTASPEDFAGQAVADDALAAAQSLITNTDMLFSDNVFVTEVRLYQYATVLKPNSGGGFRLSDAERIWYSVTPGTAGTQSTGRHPLQCSLAVSLKSDLVNRPVSSGRFYLPPQSLSIGSDGRIDSSRAGTVLGAVHDYLDDINGQWEIRTAQDFELAIVKRVYNSSQAFVSYHPVRQLRVGRVVDTQRRRRNALDEQYSVASYGV